MSQCFTRRTWALPPSGLSKRRGRPADGTGLRGRKGSSTGESGDGEELQSNCSGFGTNSTPNYLLLVGGQSPTLRNPPRVGPQPEWDMPSLPGLAEDHGVPWRAYTGKDGYPLEFYTQLKGSANVVRSATQFATDAKAGTLPPLCLMWHDTPNDEHPPADIHLG